LTLAERKRGDYLQSYAYGQFSKLKQSGTKNKCRKKYAMTSNVITLFACTSQLNKQVQA